MHVLTVSQTHSDSHLHAASQRALKALEAFLGQTDQALQLSILEAVSTAAGGLQHAKMLPKLLQVDCAYMIQMTHVSACVCHLLNLFKSWMDALRWSRGGGNAVLPGLACKLT